MIVMQLSHIPPEWGPGAEPWHCCQWWPDKMVLDKMSRTKW